MDLQRINVTERVDNVFVLRESEDTNVTNVQEDIWVRRLTVRHVASALTTGMIF